MYQTYDPACNHQKRALKEVALPMVTTIIGIVVGSFLLCLIVALLAVMRERNSPEWRSKPYNH